jgi:hypothetical protein
MCEVVFPVISQGGKPPVYARRIEAEEHVRAAGGRGWLGQGRQVEARGFGSSTVRSITHSNRMTDVRASAVDRFVDRAPDNPSAVSAVSAIIRIICAASAFGARGRYSCKRQASGSNPLTGSQPAVSRTDCNVSGALNSCGPVNDSAPRGRVA